VGFSGKMTAISKIDIINKDRPEKIIKHIIKSPVDMWGVYYVSIQYKKEINYIVKKGDLVGLIEKNLSNKQPFFTVITKNNEVLFIDESDLIGTESFKNEIKIVYRTIEKKFTDYIYFDLGI
jgi:hypothetical protein